MYCDAAQPHRTLYCQWRQLSCIAKPWTFTNLIGDRENPETVDFKGLSTSVEMTQWSFLTLFEIPGNESRRAAAVALSRWQETENTR